MKTYIFFKDGEQIQSIEAESLSEAEEKSGLKVSEEVSYSEVDTKRKPRADKGLKRVKNTTKAVKNTTRKKPEYFIFDCARLLSDPMTHDDAVKFIENETNPMVRVIMGHEISFSRKVQFHV